MNKNEREINLLKTGLKLFGENGYHGTGIKEIVDSLQVPKGSFYNYFESKEHFASKIVAYYTSLLDELWDSWIAAGSETDPMLMLENCFEQMIAMQEAQAVSTGCFIGNLAGELAESSQLCRQSLNTAKDLWCNRLAGLLAKAQAFDCARNDISAETLAGFCWDVWEGALLRMKVEKSTRSVRETMRLLFQVFLKPTA